MKIFVLMMAILLFFSACDSENDPKNETTDSDVAVVDEDLIDADEAIADDDAFEDVDVTEDVDVSQDIDVSEDIDVVVPDDDVITDPCEPNPCDQLNRTVCRNNEGVAECFCDEGFVLDGDSCINTKNVPCDASSTPENAESINEDVEISWDGSAWTFPESCRWQCQDGYTEEDGACINKKQAECDHSGTLSENSEFVIADVEITWNGTSWSSPASCAVKCLEGFISENDKCINEKQVECNHSGSLPENSEFVISNVAVEWNGTNWTLPEACSTKCLQNYISENGICINHKSVSCSKNIPLPDNAQYVDAQVTVNWDGNAWSAPAPCVTECIENYISENGSCINEKYVPCLEEGSLIPNSEFISVNVKVTWDGQQWSLADVCETRCSDGYTFENEACINEQLVNCDSSSIPPNSDAVESTVTITWNGSEWSLPAKCAWNCKSDAYPVGEDKCIVDGDTVVHPFGPYTEDFSVDGNTASKSFYNDYDGSCKTNFHPFTRDHIYAITLDANSFVTVDVSSTTIRPIVYILTDSSEESEIACENGNGENNSSVIEKDLDAGTYYIVVDGATYNDEGAYSISVTIDNPCEEPNVCSEPNKSVCSNSLGTPVCSCDEGFHDDGTGTCVSNNLCEPNPCTVAHKTKCTMADDSYSCGCDDGYQENGEGVCVVLGSSCTNPMTEISAGGTFTGTIKSSIGLDIFKPSCKSISYGGEGLIYKLTLSENSSVALDITTPFSAAVSIRSTCSDVETEALCETFSSTKSLVKSLEAGVYYLIINLNSWSGSGEISFDVAISPIYNPCSPTNTCTESNKSVCTDANLDGVAECACDEGYHDAGDGSCEEDNICNPNPCSDSHKTVCSIVDETTYTCGCDDGYQDNGEGTCVALGSSCTNPMVTISESGDYSGKISYSLGLTTFKPSCGVFRGGDGMIYKLSLADNSSVSVSMESMPFSPAVSIRKICSNTTTANELACNATASGSAASIDTKLSAGDYYLIINDNGSYGSGDFTFNVAISPIYNPCSPTNTCTDEHKSICSDVNLDGVAECACDESFHDEGGNCKSDTRNIECVDNHPENSVPVIVTYDQEWSGTSWPETPECEWNCNDGFAKNGTVCEAETVCNTPSNPCTVEHQTVCTPIDTTNYTCSCDEGYEDDGMSGCKLSSFAAESCTDIDTVAAVTTSMTFNDSTASASNDYYQSYTGKGNDHVYKMVLTENKSVTINLSATFDTVIFYGNSCGSSSMTKVDSKGANATETVTQTFTAGTWYIIADGYGSSNNGDYTLEFIFN